MKIRKPLFLGIHDFVRDHVNSEGEATFARRFAATLILWCAFFGGHFVTTVESMHSTPVLMFITDTIEGLANWNVHKNWDQVPTTGFLCEFFAALAIFFIVSFTIDPILGVIEQVMRNRYEQRLSETPAVANEDEVEIGTFERFVAVLCLMGWSEFEVFVGKLLTEDGFTVTHTHPEDHILAAALAEPQTDGGIDIEARKSSVLTLVQCKAWPDALVELDPLERLLRIMEAEKARGACFTIRGFTKEAREFAKANSIELFTATDIARKFFALSEERQTEIKDTWPMPVVNVARRLITTPSITQSNAESAIAKVSAIL